MKEITELVELSLDVPNDVLLEDRSFVEDLFHGLKTLRSASVIQNTCNSSYHCGDDGARFALDDALDDLLDVISSSRYSAILRSRRRLAVGIASKKDGILS